MYEIRLCRYDEINKLQSFIDIHWKKDHILSINTSLLKWQHFNKEDNVLNFVVAWDSVTDTFIGILGFIPLNHFDKKLNSGDLWLAIWKVAENNTQPGLGLLLFEYLEEKYGPKSIGSIGINLRVKKVYDLLKFQTNKTNQYYYLNSCKDFRIAEIPILAERPSPLNSNFILSKIDDLKKISNFNINYKPFKSIQYLINRYQQHPIYTYSFYLISSDQKEFAILVLRKVSLNNSSCLRIVDVLGDLSKIGSLESALNEMLKEHNAEYIDCINFGIEEETFKKLGFQKRNNEVIIPNYFEPFEKKNIDIQFAIKTDYNNYIIFKGDSDQDRPNFINYGL